MSVDFEAVWALLPFPVFVVDGQDRFVAVNPSGEVMVKTSSNQLCSRSLAEVFGPQSIITTTATQARETAGSLMQYNVDVAVGDQAPIVCNVHIGPFSGDKTKDGLMVIIQPTSVAQKMSRSQIFLIPFGHQRQPQPGPV